MVSYQRWTAIVQETAEEQGYTSSFDGQQGIISVAADVWQDRKEELSKATVSEARDVAQQEVEVS